ncbi:hypothetical protein XENTR_v10016054 [Xenopus tropicalis]|uniref:Uncharacterized protein n=1 Tax=Xenopus tropicalis TaxID=8364 RepID=A0A1B8Y7E0_XENTR|nr:hypothetical protein XENTR_v10016054 [Xenopus tropicalis]
MLRKPSSLGRKKDWAFDYNGIYRLVPSYQCLHRGQTRNRKIQRSKKRFRAQRMRRVYLRNRNWYYRKFRHQTLVIKILL